MLFQAEFILEAVITEVLLKQMKWLENIPQFIFRVKFYFYSVDFLELL